MAAEYYIIQSDIQKGPFSLSELKQAAISSDTMVWAAGFTDWLKASEVEELKPLFITSAPPPYQQQEKGTPPPISVAHLSQKNNLFNDGFLKKNAVVLLVSLGILVIVLTVLFTSRSGDNEEEALTEESIPVAPKENKQVTKTSGQVETPVASRTAPEPPKKRQLTDDEIKENLYLKEKSRPDIYLDASGSYKVNLAANTIITGTITNNATTTIFSNVKLVAKFYSSTDYLLGEKSFVVMDYIDPYGNLDFTHKITGWWSNIDHWSLDVVTADADRHYGFE